MGRKINSAKCPAVVVLLVMILCSSAAARTIYVDDDGPADFSNVRAAINDSNDGDTIVVADGIYRGQGNRDIDFLGKAITIRSENGPTNCVIDCNGSESNPHRGFSFHSGEDANSIIDGFTIINGYGPADYFGRWPTPAGGAIICSASSPMIINCRMSGNEALNGGGICCCNGSAPIIRNCTIDNNSGMGGGIYCLYSSPVITNCVITYNEAPWFCDPVEGICIGSSGAGVYCPDRSAIIHNCTIAYNWASDSGGGICGSPLVSNCVIWNNMAHDGYEIYGGPVVTYSNVRDGYSGLGNIKTDPRFANPSINDYHLKSQAGRWDSSSQSWVRDSIHSPCIDAGDPNSDWTAELWPNGKRINMGAYGGTAQASMSLSSIGNVADLDNDGLVNNADMMLFINKWLCQQFLLPEDLNRDSFVDFADFTILTNNWGWQE